MNKPITEMFEELPKLAKILLIIGWIVDLVTEITMDRINVLAA